MGRFLAPDCPGVKVIQVGISIASRAGIRTMSMLAIFLLSISGRCAPSRVNLRVSRLNKKYCWGWLSEKVVIVIQGEFPRHGTEIRLVVRGSALSICC